MENRYLIHHGIKGQRWGVRRYQNSDGSLTRSGKRHYSKELIKEANEQNSFIKDSKLINSIANDPRIKKVAKDMRKAEDELTNNFDDYDKYSDPKLWNRAKREYKKSTGYELDDDEDEDIIMDIIDTYDTKLNSWEKFDKAKELANSVQSQVVKEYTGRYSKKKVLDSGITLEQYVNKIISNDVIGDYT